ncbi:class II fructose-bisphosphate aldolase [Vallitalea okinawensis]|uniref:class II fructose-bisphosphate aldolase n=1 Tax=Vallitalea okinawensis TaxID=2078660 RepID=UPI000CFC9CAA|nr:class II fructose-bisphosphate aldolase [Vallitalea okinawensis]
MLVNMKEMLNYAARNNCIVPGFNVFGYEDAKMVIDVAKEMNAPALLMTNRDAAEFMDIKYYGALYRAMALNTDVNVCIHLDHGKSKEDVVKAIQAGYTSAMYDGSALSIEENIKISKEIEELCKVCDVSLEVEVGCVAYHEPHIKVEERLTEPEEVKMMAEAVDVVGIAIAVGNVHRMKEQKANIDFKRLKKVDEMTKVPLVIHGSSGIPNEQIIEMREYGIGKMNLGTTLRQAFGYTIRDFTRNNPEEFDRITLMRQPMEEMKKVIRDKYHLLGW